MGRSILKGGRDVVGILGIPRLWQPEAAVTEQASLPRWPYICCAFGTAFLASDRSR